MNRTEKDLSADYTDYADLSIENIIAKIGVGILKVKYWRD